MRGINYLKITLFLKKRKERKTGESTFTLTIFNYMFEQLADNMVRGLPTDFRNICEGGWGDKNLQHSHWNSKTRSGVSYATQVSTHRSVSNQLLKKKTCNSYFKKQTQRMTY